MNVKDVVPSSEPHKWNITGPRATYSLWQRQQLSRNVPCLEHDLRSQETHFVVMWYPRENWIRKWDWFSKSQTLEQRNIKWIYHIPYHPQASRKTEKCWRLLGNGTWKHWDANSAEVTWLVNARGYANCTNPAQTKPTDTVGGYKVPALHTGKWLGKSAWILLPWEKESTLVELSLRKDLGVLGR